MGKVLPDVGIAQNMGSLPAPIKPGRVVPVDRGVRDLQPRRQETVGQSVTDEAVGRLHYTPVTARRRRL